MLSPDVMLQAPSYSQNHNRYTYALNNPLKFTDPSGNNWEDVVKTSLNILTFPGRVLSGATAFINDRINGNNTQSFGSYFSQGYLSGNAAPYSVNSSMISNPGSTAFSRLSGGRRNFTSASGDQYRLRLIIIGNSPLQGTWSNTGKGFSQGGYSETITGVEWAKIERPDADGYLTLSEANDWYRNGRGQQLNVNLSQLDLSGIHADDFNGVGDVKYFNLLFKSNSANDGLVYGNIGLRLYPNNMVRAFSDKYDFDQKPWTNPLNWGRNLETYIGGYVAGAGIPYEINFNGSVWISPINPRQK